MSRALTPAKTHHSLKNHLRKHWHHHLALWGTIAAALLLSTGAAIAHHVKGGYKPGPMPPPIHISGGTLPDAWSLAPYITRIHNQGSSNSCVGQTLATIGEIIARERGHTFHFSAGYIYDQVNGGVDEGTTYDAAFHVLVHQGDATLKAFPHDGIDYLAQPDLMARVNAGYHRFRGFRSIVPTDVHTIEYELYHGRPIALAIPVHDSFYNHFNTGSVLSSDDGAFHFWHSITVIGYSPTGIRVLNSWGPTWGENGQATITWGLLAAYGAGMEISTPRPPKAPAPGPVIARTPVPSPTPRPTATARPSARATKTPLFTPNPALTATALANPTPKCPKTAPVYHPDRLRLLLPCVTVRGTALAVIHEAYDGDVHIWLKVTSPANLLNSLDVYHGVPALVLEISPDCATPPADHTAARSCPQSPLPAPMVGQTLTASGPLQIDTAHGWNEVHPLTSIELGVGGSPFAHTPSDHAP